MDDRSLKVLDFFHLLDILKALSISPLGRRRCEALRPFTDHDRIQSRLAEVLELTRILETLGEIPIQGLKDNGNILKKLDIEGHVLEVRELLEVHQHLELCKGLKRFFQKLAGIKAPRLQERVSQLSSLKALEKEILQALSPKGEILDRASPALSDIRRRIGALRENAKELLERLLHRRDLQAIFQEQLITVRNGRYVLPVKTDAEPRLQGIIHDHSQSHMTFFLEPLQVVSLNNDINILAAQEKEEEFRILGDLSDRIRAERAVLQQDVEILGELDLLYAMAKLTLALGGVAPTLREGGEINIRQARNPLLVFQEKEKVVPVDLRMGGGIKVLILSGANAGGKTVALKTMGLLTAMTQCGLPIPAAEDSQVSLFHDIFAIVGDEQDLGENLSTFSSHLVHLNEILRKTGPRSLLLLDELGVGTHASEGCALAMGFLDGYRERGASIVVTTHFDRLKLYGYLYPDVENVSVEFDEKTLEPKYTLRYRSSGVSNAFLVAEKLGISEKVMDAARRYRDGSGEEVGQALEALERVKVDTERERVELQGLKEKLSSEHKRLKEAAERLKARRQEILGQAELRARKAAQQVEEELKEWLRRKKEEKALSKAARPLTPRKEIQEIKERYFPPEGRGGPPVPPTGLKIGDRVRILSLRRAGVLMALDESIHQAEVMTEKARVKTFLSDLVPAGEETEPAVEPSGRAWGSQGEAGEIRSELNVIGLTVEDALPRVDRFIDQALLHGLEKVQIVHGVGSGRLRSAIGKYLQDHRAVKRADPGDAPKGGAAITIVELR